MATSILSSPDVIYPAFNDINFVVSSDKTAQNNFRYVCDIYVSGVTDPTYFRIKANSHPTTTYGYFNVSDVIRKYVSYNLHIGTEDGFMRCTDSMIQFTCKFGEEYGASSTGTTVYANQSTTTKYAWNSSFLHNEFANYSNLRNSYILQTSTRKMLTKAPTYQKMRSTTNRWLYVLAKYHGAGYYCDRMFISVDDGSTLSPFEITNPYKAITANGYEVLAFPVGIDQLKAIPQHRFYSGTAANLSTALDNAIAYSNGNGGVLTFYTLDNAGGQTSEARYFYLNDFNCTSDTVYTLHWLNELGGIDTFDFIRASKKITNVERVEYKKDHRTYGTTVGYSPSNLSKANLSTKANVVRRINSDFINNDEATHLESLIKSPLVWWEYDTSTLLPVKININSYETKQVRTDGMFNVTFEFETMNDSYSQQI